MTYKEFKTLSAENQLHYVLSTESLSYIKFLQPAQMIEALTRYPGQIETTKKADNPELQQILFDKSPMNSVYFNNPAPQIWDQTDLMLPMRSLDLETWIDINYDYLMTVWDETKYEKHGESFHYDDIDFFNEDLFNDMAVDMYLELQDYYVQHESVSMNNIDMAFTGFNSVQEAKAWQLKHDQGSKYRIIRIVNG